MSRATTLKRGIARVYTKLNGYIKRHAGAESARGAKSGDMTKEIAGYSNDFAAVNLVNGIIANPDDIMMAVAPGKMSQYQKLRTDPYLLHRYMRKTDLKYRSLIQTRKNGVLAKEWEVVPNAYDTDSDRAVQVADFVTAALAALGNFQGDLEQLLDGIALGFAVSEIIWEQRTIAYGAGQSTVAWVPRAIKQRRQGLFGFAEDWSLRFQESADKFVEVPEGKFIVHTHAAENDSRYGTSEAGEVFWAYYMKHYFVKWWAIYGEKFGMPTAVGKYPPNWDDAKKKLLRDLLRKIQTEFGIVIPQGAQVEFLEGAKAGSINTYKDFIEWVDKCLSEAITGQSLATGQGESGRGSYAQSKTHGEVKQEYIESDAKELMATINTQLICYLVWLNFGEDCPLPTWKINFEAKDLASDLEMDIKLMDAGVPLPLYYFYTKYGRPIPADDEPIVGGSKPREPESDNDPEPTNDDEEDDDADGGKTDSDDAGVDTINNSRGHRHACACAAHKRGAGDNTPALLERAAGRVRFAVTPEARSEIERNQAEADRITDVLVDSGTAVFGALGDEILHAAENASDLSDLRERVQRISAGGVFNAALAYELTKAKINGYLLAAAQVQRYADEVALEEADENQEEFARRKRFSNLTDLLADYEPLEPSKALDWFNNLVPMPKDELDRLPREAEGHAISVADIETRENLAKVQELIASYIQTGKTLDQFIKDYQALRKELGLDPVENHKAELLFRSEVGRAYGAGRNQALRSETIQGAFPLWQYIAVNDDRTRIEHQALDGFVAAPDDTVWLTKSPPWDYNCRCDLIPLTRRQIDKLGIVETGTVTMPDGSEVDPRTWPTSPGYRGLGF